MRADVVSGKDVQAPQTAEEHVLGSRTYRADLRYDIRGDVGVTSCPDRLQSKARAPPILLSGEQPRGAAPARGARAPRRSRGPSSGAAAGPGVSDGRPRAPRRHHSSRSTSRKSASTSATRRYGATDQQAAETAPQPRHLRPDRHGLHDRAVDLEPRAPRLPEAVRSAARAASGSRCAAGSARRGPPICSSTARRPPQRQDPDAKGRGWRGPREVGLPEHDASPFSSASTATSSPEGSVNADRSAGDVDRIAPATPAGSRRRRARAALTRALGRRASRITSAR